MNREPWRNCNSRKPNHLMLIYFHQYLTYLISCERQFKGSRITKRSTITTNGMRTLWALLRVTLTHRLCRRSTPLDPSYLSRSRFARCKGRTKRKLNKRLLQYHQDHEHLQELAGKKLHDMLWKLKRRKQSQMWPERSFSHQCLQQQDQRAIL